MRQYWRVKLVHFDVTENISCISPNPPRHIYNLPRPFFRSREHTTTRLGTVLESWQLLILGFPNSPPTDLPLYVSAIPSYCVILYHS